MPRRQLPGGGAGMSYLATRYSAVHAQEREWLLHIHDAERRDIAQVDQGVFVTGRPPENLSLLASFILTAIGHAMIRTGPIDARWAVRRCPVRG
eukprot:COSAG03_NODE_4517_length_1525_cov_1.161992_2_plen_94_part_00